jgi:hypothetical protein
MSLDLTALRRTIARLERQVAPRRSAEAGPRPRADLPGGEARNDLGKYWLAEKFYPGHRRHGSVEIDCLAELPPDHLSAISRGEIPPAPPSRWVFLDTETTGLAGGSGTCAFLIGVGTIEDRGFRVRLFFMRDYDEEPAMLAALAEFLSHYEVVITYNGKAYDAPLLETRYRLARQRPPLERLAHLDLLYAARRLWRVRLESCRLVELEHHVLGVEREGDLPGEMIPYYYFEYLRTREAFRLVPLFHHNVMDIVTLAALTAVVLPVFAAPADSGLRHAEDLLGMARWLEQGEDFDGAIEMYRRAVDRGLRDPHLFRALFETARLERKLGRLDRAVAVWCDLASGKNPFRRAALEELAKYYEHVERNYPMALEMTAAAIRLGSAPELVRRQERLARKAASHSRRLL